MGESGTVYELRARDSFAAFAADVEPRLRRALIPVLGVDLATDATAEALSYGWEHWGRVSGMNNPAGYLYRVARSKARKLTRRTALLPKPDPIDTPWIEPGLPVALAQLSERQRTVVWLVHGFGWRQVEVADLLGISAKSVETHLRRGTEKLNQLLGGQP